MLAGPIIGAPGVSDTYKAQPRKVFWSPMQEAWLAGGKTIDGTLSRDPGNGVITNLRPGLLLGKVAATGFYAPSIIGVLTNAEAHGSTSLEASAATITELVRRVGASGTFKVTSPPAASGVVRTTTVTYSAATGTTITATGTGTNQVEQINFDVASTAGNLKLNIQKPDGTFATSGNMAWSATDATYIASINTALDTATGVVGGIVASAIPSVDTDLGIRLTYSGTGYAGLSWTPAEVALFPTSSVSAIYTSITAAVEGRFIAGGLIQPTDGSETPITFVPDGFPIPIANYIDGTGVYAQFHKLPIAGAVHFAQLLPAVTDTSLKSWIKQSLSSLEGGKFSFYENY